MATGWSYECGITAIGIPDREAARRCSSMFAQVASVPCARSEGGPRHRPDDRQEARRDCTAARITAAKVGGTGKGSTFIVRLPLPVKSAPQRAPESADPSKPEAATTLRILVVDDNWDSAESLATLLELKQHEIRTAHDGPEALRVLQAFHPDVALLDIGLPGMNGYELARRIRENGAFREMTLVALTGWGQDEDRRRTKEAGFDHHLVKLAEPEAVEQVLRAVVRPGSG